MTHLHAFVMARQVLYLGVSDTPAWVVVKANECRLLRENLLHAPELTSNAVARKNGLTPFSVYQGRWNAAYRDMESEIIPMCQDQGMGVLSWASLGGGQLTTSAQRKAMEQDPKAPKNFYGFTESDVAVCDVLEKLAAAKKTTFQAIVSWSPPQRPLLC